LEVTGLGDFYNDFDHWTTHPFDFGIGQISQDGFGCPILSGNGRYFFRHHEIMGNMIQTWGNSPVKSEETDQRMDQWGWVDAISGILQ
jgi:hypothetical protein